MDTKLCFILIITLYFIEDFAWTQITRASNTFDGKFTEVHQDKRYTSVHILMSQICPHATHCIAHCLYHKLCSSVNWNPMDGICELLSLNTVDQSVLDDDRGWIYYGTKDTTTTGINCDTYLSGVFHHIRNIVCCSSEYHGEQCQQKRTTTTTTTTTPRPPLLIWQISIATGSIKAITLSQTHVYGIGTGLNNVHRHGIDGSGTWSQIIVGDDVEYIYFYEDEVYTVRTHDYGIYKNNPATLAQSTFTTVSSGAVTKFVSDGPFWYGLLQNDQQIVVKNKNDPASAAWQETNPCSRFTFDTVTDFDVKDGIIYAQLSSFVLKMCSLNDGIWRDISQDSRITSLHVSNGFVYGILNGAAYKTKIGFPWIQVSNGHITDMAIDNLVIYGIGGNGKVYKVTGNQ